MMAEQYVNLGYQRLLTFRSADGGFNLWGGNSPSDTFLTAYGLMQFNDMSKVRDVDPAVLSGARRWLIARQNPDGSWGDSYRTRSIHSGTFTPFEFTAQVVWALAGGVSQERIDSGQQASLTKGVTYLQRNLGAAVARLDTYGLALCANALAASGHNAQLSNVLAQLDDMKTEIASVCYWPCSTQTFTYGRNVTADIETTALTALAMVQAGGNGRTVERALDYLIERKDRFGGWYSTQATVLSLKALAAAAGKTAERGKSTVRINVNGRAASALEIARDQSDLSHTVDLTDCVRPGENRITLTASGETRPMFQLLGRYWMRAHKSGSDRQSKDIDISVAYDRSALRQNDMVRSSVVVRYLRSNPTYMVIADLGIPPGFVPLREDLDALVTRGVIQRFEITATQVIVYLDRISAASPAKFSYRMKAKFPVKARVPASRAYDYYNPSTQDRAIGQRVTVST